MSRLIFCWMGFHNWRKWGGTRVGGLYRECCNCKRKEEGYEDGRDIRWFPMPAAREAQP